MLGTVKLAYFVHDLTDPAVTRRVRMLKAGGADPVVLGFRRLEAAPEDVAGAPVVDLGRTYDARFGHRATRAVLTALKAGGLRAELAGVRVFLARTLEMLTIAEAARRAAGSEARLVYECLDVHRLMLRRGPQGVALRGLERRLLRRSDLLIVSSPAFLERYFEPLQGVGRSIRVPALVVENKVLSLDAAPPHPPPPPPPGPPWRIGWLGAIRCRRSLDFLTGLARRRPDLVEVRIHGRPAYTEVGEFDGQVAASPSVSFGGPYAAEDLPRLYGECHFAWAIDFMEEGMNSAWLLPNRLYEASRHGAVPIALAQVQTGRRLAELGVGLPVADTAELESRLQAMTPDGYARLRRALQALPANTFAADDSDCRRLVAALAGAKSACQTTGARLVA